MMCFQKKMPYILCCCLCIRLAAQTSNRIDSLEQVLTIGKLKDMEKAELLKNLASAYSGIDNIKCRMYAIEAIKLAQSIGSKKVEAFSYLPLAKMQIPGNMPWKRSD